MHQPPSAMVSFGTESARLSKWWRLLGVCSRIREKYKEKQKEIDEARREVRQFKKKTPRRSENSQPQQMCCEALVSG